MLCGGCGGADAFPSGSHRVFASGWAVEVHVSNARQTHCFAPSRATSLCPSGPQYLPNSKKLLSSNSDSPLIEFIQLLCRPGLHLSSLRPQSAAGTFSCCANTLADPLGVMLRQGKPPAQISTARSSQSLPHPLHLPELAPGNPVSPHKSEPAEVGDEMLSAHAWVPPLQVPCDKSLQMLWVYRKHSDIWFS